MDILTKETICPYIHYKFYLKLNDTLFSWQNGDMGRYREVCIEETSLGKQFSGLNCNNYEVLK